MEYKVKQLEKRVAALEVRSQEQPSGIKVGISNLDELTDLVTQTTENLNKIKDFKFETVQSRE